MWKYKYNTPSMLQTDSSQFSSNTVPFIHMFTWKLPNSEICLCDHFSFLCNANIILTRYTMIMTVHKWKQAYRPRIIKKKKTLTGWSWCCFIRLCLQCAPDPVRQLPRLNLVSVSGLRKHDWALLHETEMRLKTDWKEGITWLDCNYSQGSRWGACCAVSSLSASRSVSSPPG